MSSVIKNTHFPETPEKLRKSLSIRMYNTIIPVIERVHLHSYLFIPLRDLSKIIFASIRIKDNIFIIVVYTIIIIIQDFTSQLENPILNILIIQSSLTNRGNTIIAD